MNKFIDNSNFAIRLVKGKIAETIFEQMFRETKNFTILGFGYEKVIPELVQQGYKESEKTLEIIKTAPDFAVISKTQKEVKLVEVKYMKTLDYDFIYKDANRMKNSWNPSYLFVATQLGFYFGDVETVLKNNGDIPKLDERFVSKELQDKFCKILIDFEADN